MFNKSVGVTSQFPVSNAGFRNQMLNAIKGFSRARQNGLFINSCFAHCQSERSDTWFADNSPVIGNKVGAACL